ncbi:S-Ena type endospore appendage [Peribacillus simplex]|uniref:S-Ena type endospore appendage n=1 Tax=Peribacillus simplex TaxID=1478 RepID=UPI00366C3A48
MGEQKKCSDCKHTKCRCKHEKCRVCGHKKCKCIVEKKIKVKVNIPTEMSGPIVCNSTCGNLLLTDQVQSLEIWKARISMDATVTISVFNSAMSTASVRVLVIRNDESPVEFSVPSGNTLSATVDAAESIIVFRIGTGRTEGKYFLDVCFPVICDDKRKHKKDK